MTSLVSAVNPAITEGREYELVEDAKAFYRIGDRAMMLPVDAVPPQGAKLVNAIFVIEGDDGRVYDPSYASFRF